MKTNLIEELERKVEQAEKELGIAEEGLRNAKLKRAKKAYGIDYKVIVIHEGKEYKIASIDVSWRDKPWVKGYGLNKDGKWSKSIKNLFDDWELKR